MTSINASINLADELVILLIFINNEHFVHAVGKDVACRQNANANSAWPWVSRDSKQKKNNYLCVNVQVKGGYYFQHLM